MQKFKVWQQKLDIKLQESKDNFLKTKIYALGKKGIGMLEKVANVYFNFNSTKDIVFKEMCTNNSKKYPEFITKNKTIKNTVEKFDKFFVKIFEKPHKVITSFFDSVSKKTVKQNYKSALTKMNKFEEALILMKDKLPESEQKIVEAKLKEIATAKDAFTEDSLLKRFAKQEELMSELENGLLRKLQDKSDSTSYWVRDILSKQREQTMNEGIELVGKLTGSKNKKGLYDEVLDICEKSLTPEEMKVLKDRMKTASMKLKKANQSECGEYFDKKRDLIVGGAPTDVVSQILGLGLCGLAVGKADKDERISKLITNGIPIITGLASSLIFSALLFSGPVGLVAGAIVSGITGLVCHLIDKFLLNNNKDSELSEKTEVKNA